MTFKKKTKVLISTVIVATSTNVVSFAHSGRTDTSGGHKDNKNVSGLGSYHYHHGYSAHLHPNGVCEYSSNNNTNTTANTSSNIRSVDSLKKEAIDNGYNKGYEDGFNVNGFDDTNSSTYSMQYKEGYTKGFNTGVEEFANKIDEVHKKGYDRGVTGEEADNNEKEDNLITAYNEGYTEGHNIYIKEKSEEYSKMGKEDAINFVDMVEIDETISLALKVAYETAYAEEMTLMELDTNNQGFSLALKGVKYKKQNFNNELKEKWFKAGYDDGISKLKVETEIAYNRGINNEEYEIPTHLSLGKEIILKVYNKGLKEKEAKDKESLVIGATSIALVGAGIVGSKVYKKKKS